MVAKTAATMEDELTARSIWSLHEDGVSPTDIAGRLDVPKKVVRDALNGRRLAPAISQRSAATVKRCPCCGKRVLSLPCLACEIEGNWQPQTKAAEPAPPCEPEYELIDNPAMDWKPMGRPPKPRKLDDRSMAQIRKSLCCGQCGEERMRTPSGYVCPHGHGRIAPPIDPLDEKSFRFTQRLRSLPQASPVGRFKNIVRIHGESEQRYRRVPNRSATQHCREVAVGSEIWFVEPKETQQVSTLDRTRRAVAY